ncbi:WG repeat-containing protein [Dawidia soli]|uniref:WG repeat-containing protein n=1 Tax=Dawidia soli TaxID=2782352 RepID=A0AAP2D7N8_9BACT|nr:WG repeat-containing protein [Dawidia soli]MBT1686784.1 WG repeat-containing protein [Dawidia soli]
MINKLTILCLTLLAPVCLWAQFAPERAAWSNLSRQKWERAYEQGRKALHRDSVNATANYVMASYFFTPENPAFQIDSAYRYTLAAQADYRLTTPRQRDRLKRFPLDSLVLVRLRERIDSAAFGRAQKLHTEKAYVDFLASFPAARQQAEARDLRDEVAFEQAVSHNTYQAFGQYLARYPEARRAPEARSRYEQLLYEASTRDQHLSSYEQFVHDHPASPYRAEAERNIFEIATAAGTVEPFIAFLEKYPHSRERTGARNLLYHLLPEDLAVEQLPRVLQHDSLARVLSADHGYLVPFLHKGYFGFMDEDGKEVLDAAIGELESEYLCGNIHEDVLILPEGIMARNGVMLYRGAVSGVDDLGAGFLLVQGDACTRVVHKTGFVPLDSCIQEARLLSGRLLAIRTGDHWSVRTLAGRLLLGASWDDVQAAGNVVILKKNDKYWLTTVDQVACIADQQPLGLRDVFNDVKPWPNGLIWFRAGSHEGVLGQHLDIQVPPRQQRLAPAFFGALATTDDTRQILYDTRHQTANPYDSLAVNEPWVAAKAAYTWYLLLPARQAEAVAAYDSLFMAGPFAVGVKNDSLFSHMTSGAVLPFDGTAHIEFVPGQDSSAFLAVDYNKVRTVYSRDGRKLFSGGYDRIQYAGQGLFIVSKKEKKGLVTDDGKPVLPVEYDAIGSASNGTVSLLRAMKFGMFDIVRKKLIKPLYAKNLQPYNDQAVVAFKDGHYGFTGWDNDTHAPGEFGFTEIKAWNDSVALVKKESDWMLYNIATHAVVLDNIKGYELIRDTPAEKLAIIRQDNRYGVLHSRRGTIIPITYSDIVNVGSAEIPMYFTEKHVEEASLFVVIYYRHDGQLIRKEVYDQDAYEKIYCSDL